MSNRILIAHPTRAIALAFGYDEKLTKHNKKGIEIISDNTVHRCCSCGRIHNNGYLMTEKKELFSDRTNNFYSMQNHNQTFYANIVNIHIFIQMQKQIQLEKLSQIV